MGRVGPGSRAEFIIGPRFAPTRWRSAGMTSGVLEAYACLCTSAHTFFLVKYISPEKMIRKIITWKPTRLRASRCGSAAHIMNCLLYTSDAADERSSVD